MACFIVLLRYTAPIEDVDAHLADHVEWLRENHREGHFMGWGRRVPREGGLILAKGENKNEVAILAATDPFVTGGVAEFEVIEWAPGFLDESIAGLG